MKNLNALRDEVFAINKDNGWHEEKRSFGELIALVHSEVSEALEDYRNGKAVNKVWYEYSVVNRKTHAYINELGNEILGKPCGIPSELADIVIRILDICGLYEWDIEYDYKIPTLLFGFTGFVEGLNAVHTTLSFATYYKMYDEESNDHDAKKHLVDAIRLVEELCYYDASQPIDLESIILQKLEYNKTRGYKHGGKVI